MEMICQNPAASAETKRKRKRDRSGDKKKTNLVSQNASAMDEMGMISQTAGASCGNKGKMKRCTKLNHGRSGDKKKSSPNPNLVEMVRESGAGTSGEKKNSSPKPKLKYTEKRNPNKMEMICQKPGASGETKRKRKRDRSGDKNKSSSPMTNFVGQNADSSGEKNKSSPKPMDEMEMINQTAGASCGNKGKMRRCTKLNHGRSGDKKKSSPKPNLVEMVSESGASGEKKNSSPKPKLKYKRSDMAPRKEDMESDASLMAFYERWCCYHKINRSPDEMKERFKYFKKDAISLYKFNKDRTSAPYVLWYFSDWSPEESRWPTYCLTSPPVSDEEMRCLRMRSRRRRMRRIQMGPPKKKLG